MKFPRILSTILSLFAAASHLLADDVFQAAVRTTEPLTAQEERLRLQVPDGFTVTLFAAEPQIQKPLNMAFDADGRLWVTGSNQYPFPADGNVGTDTVRILEDTDGDGAADKVTTFADDLNIPIGVYPYRNGAIVFSIPNIWYLEDTDGDNKADKRTKLYGPFDTSRDTHGMNNSFRRGFDGWLYCCHGFNNQTEVAGADGHSVTMHSGNTYRIRLDGSRIEHFTHGQVNPFGMSIDANGDIFTSDCHTKPVMMLMRDGYCESFSKPHDGLGFVPHVMDHLHGSTAIDALCQYQDDVFPPEYHDDFFVGNVMTSRIHRNSIVRNGASIRMQEEEDFLVSEDPWFRPVDMQVGPDGALYVADFYNRIIGHYEVPLDHAGRDRSRGRIWRIARTEQPAASQSTALRLKTADLPSLIERLSDRRKTVRQHAADQITDRFDNSVAENLRGALRKSFSEENQTAAPQLLWLLQCFGAAALDDLIQSYTQGSERTRIHVMRVCSEFNETNVVQDIIRSGLRDPAALVQRAGADAASRHLSITLAKEVINSSVVAPLEDVHLRHALKIALRNQFHDQEVVDWFVSSPPPNVAMTAVREILPGLTGPNVGRLAVFLLGQPDFVEQDLVALLEHAATHASDSDLASLSNYVTLQSTDDVRDKMEIWQAFSAALRLRGRSPSPQLLAWSNSLAEQILSAVNTDEIFWGQYSLDGAPFVRWGIEQRRPEPGTERTTDFLSSLPGSEKAVGAIRSRSFVMPFDLTIRVCGHLGHPDRGPVPANRVVLRDAESGEELKSVLAPRNDTASVVEWNLIPFAGRRAFLEVVDGIDEKSFAWIGIGATAPPVAKPATFDAGGQSQLLETGIRILLQRQLTEPQLSADIVKQLQELVGLVHVDGSVRTVAAQALLLHHKKSAVIALTDLLQIAATPVPVADRIVDFCRKPPSSNDSELALKLIIETFRNLGPNLRTRLVNGMVSSRAGAELLLQAIESGVPGPGVLRDASVTEKLRNLDDATAKRVTTILETLPPQDDDHSELVAAVAKQQQLGKGNAEAGGALFRKHCLSCHRRQNDGGIAGPQLDGIATRGPLRILEDVLQPNRNVDINFRTSTLVMTDGRLMSGLVQRRPGPPEVVRLVAVDGKVTHVNPDEIELEKPGQLSLMPANFSQTLTQDQLVDLLAFLME